MELLESILLGILQGVTEFLPVSSSGHLVLAQELLNRDLEQGITFEIVVHFGSFFSILIYFWTRIIDILKNFFTFLSKPARYKSEWKNNYDARISVYILLSMIPAGIVGFTLRSNLEAAFSSPVLVSGMLLVTGSILYLNKFISPKQGKVTPKNAIIMGVAQAFAMIPGISRSGTTITTGVLLGMKREDVADFSFLMLLPVIAGAMLLEGLELMETGGGDIVVLSLVGAFFASLVSGYYSLKFLLKLFKQKGLHFFAYYCWSVGLLGIIYFSFK
ncbi:MAG: undecaprenyl-diphosphate phosphatase [Bacteroidetes bacterium]|nr:undecaprenyl-diphosphate phosphatase [Bacteroidota bacterium]MCH8524080.1 undecaprenyl-diphosphate phosphatase [Balneolales bacterium]